VGVVGQVRQGELRPAAFPVAEALQRVEDLAVSHRVEYHPAEPYRAGELRADGPRVANCRAYWGACRDAAVGQAEAFPEGEHPGVNRQEPFRAGAPFQAENRAVGAFRVELLDLTLQQHRELSAAGGPVAFRVAPFLEGACRRPGHWHRVLVFLECESDQQPRLGLPVGWSSRSRHRQPTVRLSHYFGPHQNDCHAAHSRPLL
jgi:hypothetical protein